MKDLEEAVNICPRLAKGSHIMWPVEMFVIAINIFFNWQNVLDIVPF